MWSHSVGSWSTVACVSRALVFCHAGCHTGCHTGAVQGAVMSCNTLDCADSSHAVHVTFCTRHHLPTAPGHLSPIPRAWNLSPRFVSLFGPLPYVHFLSHLCLYVTQPFMIQFLLCPFVSPYPYVSTSIPTHLSDPRLSDSHI